jgi:hypothetical protein
MGEEVHGDEAGGLSRRGLVVVGCHGEEVTAAVAGLTLIFWGSMLWRHGILGFSYSSKTADGETTRSFKSMESPVDPALRSLC